MRSIGTLKSRALRPSAANESGSALATTLTSNVAERTAICEERKARIVSGEETTKQMRCLAGLTGGSSRSETCAISADHHSLGAVEPEGRSPLPANGEGAEQLRNQTADSKGLEEHRRGKER